MSVLVIGLVCLVVGFVFGVLFGRRNRNKVEAAVAEGKKLSGGRL